MKKTVLSLLAATVLAAGCASKAPVTAAAPAPAAPAKPASTHTAAQAQEAIAAAEKSEAAAAAVSYEWRDTGAIIADAKKAAKEDDFDKAVALATQAQHQGDLAVKQQETEAAKMMKK